MKVSRVQTVKIHLDSMIYQHSCTEQNMSTDFTRSLSHILPHIPPAPRAPRGKVKPYEATGGEARCSVFGTGYNVRASAASFESWSRPAGIHAVPKPPSMSEHSIPRRSASRSA